MQTSDRLTPQDLDAEMQVLAAAMMPDGMSKVVEILKPSDFYLDAHRHIFRAMLDLTADNRPVDLVSVHRRLADAGRLEAIGGVGYLAEVSNAGWTTANIEHHAAIVAQKSACRDLIRVASDITAMAYGGGDVAEMIEKAERSVCSVRDQRARVTAEMTPLSDVVSEVYTDIEQRSDGDLTEAIPTQLTDLDSMLSGGLYPQELFIIAARPAMGKTALAMNIATNVAGIGKTVAVFSLEMGKKQIGARMLATESKINGKRLQMGWVQDGEWSKLQGAMTRLAGLNLWIDDASDLNPTNMRAKLRRLRTERGSIGLVVVDYLQLMEGGSDEGSRVQEISKISRGLKALAREFDCPVVALSQLSRAVEQRTNKRPMMSDIRESGAIEQDADVILFVYRDDYYDPESDKKNVAELIVAKHRKGETGTVNAYFDKNLTAFRGLEM